jgi:SpoVK/Ycf46/Vps4 family AAA+-type ATPase
VDGGGGGATAGAELAGLCREAALAALREDLQGARQVAARHFGTARAACRAPSLAPLAIAAFAAWQQGSSGPFFAA